MLGLVTRQVPALLSGCRVFAARCPVNRTGEAGVHRIAPVEPLDRCEFVDVLSIQLMPRVPNNLGVGRCGISQRVARHGNQPIADVCQRAPEAVPPVGDGLEPRVDTDGFGGREPGVHNVSLGLRQRFRHRDRHRPVVRVVIFISGPPPCGKLVSDGRHGIGDQSPVLLSGVTPTRFTPVLPVRVFGHPFSNVLLCASLPERGHPHGN